MLFGSQPGVDSRIAALHPFPDESDLPWPSTYHSYRPHLGLPQHSMQGIGGPDPCLAWAPDATVNCFAFVVPGNDHTSLVPEDWNGWLPPHPDELPPPPTPKPRSRKEQRKSKRSQLKISDEVAKRLQSQLQSATRGVSLRKIFSKHDTDRSGTLTASELKKMIRKELRITAALVSDRDVEDLATALDGDRTGNISIDELLGFIERGSSTFYASSPLKEVPKSRDSSGDDDDTDASEKKAPSGALRQPSKTVLASMKDPYNRFVFRPLTPPLGGSLITLDPPLSRTQRARKASVARARPKELPEPRDPKKNAAEPLKDQKESEDNKGGRPWQTGSASAGSAYWLRGTSQARPNTLQAMSARGRPKTSRTLAYGRGLPFVSTNAAPKKSAAAASTAKASTS